MGEQPNERAATMAAVKSRADFAPTVLRLVEVTMLYLPETKMG
jgi:hypothetical protein